MDGREIALGTLHRQDVPAPCMTNCWVTNSRFFTQLTGREYWDDPVSVFCESVRLTGANLVPQWYIPGESQRKLEVGEIMHDVRQHEQAGFRSPEDVLRHIEQLPDDEAVERGFNVEQAAEAYAADILGHSELLGPDVLVISHFGQSDFMGGYTRWGYENYLMAAALYPEAMRRYYHHSALGGRLLNQAIGLAVEKHGLAPFVFTGQDICGSAGPVMAPALLRDLYFPELRWCLEPLHDAGVGVVWHCDGNIMPILDDIMNLGVVGLQGFEEEHGVDYARMVELKDQAGTPVIIWGCVSVTSTLPHGTPEDVKRSVERSFELAGRGRGFVLSSTSSILPEVPIENINALFQHANEFGREFMGG